MGTVIQGFSINAFITAVVCGLLFSVVYAANSRAEMSPGTGLSFALDDKGLASLSYNGESLLAAASSGHLQSGNAVFRSADGGVSTVTTSPTTNLDTVAQRVTLTYPWGSVSGAYRQEDNRLMIRLEVRNISENILARFPLVLTELNFPGVAKGRTLEAGMFGYGFGGVLSSLSGTSLVADPRSVAPVIEVDSGIGAVNFCSDDLDVELNVSHADHSSGKTTYPFIISLTDVQPGRAKTCAVSLRFGRARATVSELSGDVLQKYTQRYPFQLKWKDRRPIGMIYLASSGTKVPSNPRRWIMKNGNIDISTDEGKNEFRRALLDWADNSIKVLNYANAQGMVTWDPEGQEFLGSVYYGDPRLTPTLAPEMEFKNSSGTSTADEYFQRFRDAGLKVGVCVRPQQIRMANGIPVQEPADDEHAAQVLKDKIGYAKRRWDCTLFYVDSTYAGPRPLNPDVFKAVAEAYPAVLLMPENESMRYFAYTAPLNSYVHHNVTSTPVGARAIYSGAFSVLMAPSGDKPEHHDALVAAVRCGDILLFNGWYPDPAVDKIKKIYEEAARKH